MSLPPLPETLLSIFMASLVALDWALLRPRGTAQAWMLATLIQAAWVWYCVRINNPGLLILSGVLLSIGVKNIIVKHKEEKRIGASNNISTN